MPSRKLLTLPRYIACVALVYLLAIGMMLGYLGERHLGLDRHLLTFWPLAVGAVGLAVLGTIVPIARFGPAGGSIYVFPTALHVFMLIALAIATLTLEA